MAENDVEYTKPTTQLDAEARLAVERGETPEGVGAPRSYAVEGNDLSGYVGVNPEYQNYADETHAPLTADEGVEAELAKRHLAALSTDLPEGVESKDADGNEVERAEPQGAAYNIPAVGPDGQPTGDAEGTDGEKKGRRGRPAAE